ncbi:hypothetical protein T310_6858 [Rasamsonia emersonii CBS 393.64]|uniref:Uncharacterized protein n=1 Tax=Rasamsonia emersonii (strain ATCC 16479 / CBS 393.64 / IMI 116815) TaxID=1408163 RepID=A0A0F4YNH4_RASE3|nr:hypothetical protein T310_6858 [Rasamsonia emersonii CBS 393.64]KKA19183.1 hypothetical protein T310_6858 [Rasamsonia emersonii CBS 393.64]
MCPERIIHQRVAGGDIPLRRPNDVIRHESPLQTQHGLHNPRLPGGTQLVAIFLRFGAVFEAVAERVAWGTAVEARFETERVEAAVVGLGVGAFFECAGVGVAAARGGLDTYPAKAAFAWSWIIAALLRPMMSANNAPMSR